MVPGGRFVENRAGWTRAYRLFAGFSLALVVVYVAVVADAVVAVPGVASDTVALAILTALAGAFVVAGASVTITRAPRGVWWTPEELIVQERYSRPRRFPKSVPRHVARRFPAGLLAPGPTEIVEVVPALGRRMTYLVDEGLLTEGSG